jgi:hypothetical protein
MQAWLKADFVNTNWWWNVIGVPMCVAKYLMLLPNAAFLTQAQVIFARVTLAVVQMYTGYGRKICTCIVGIGSFLQRQ